MTPHEDEPVRPRRSGGAELDRLVELSRRQFDTLLDTTGKLGAGSTAEEALAALSLTLEELELTAEELRARNEELTADRRMLEQERQRFRELFDMAPEAYLVTDVSGVILHANRQAGRLLGRDVGELVGELLAVFVHGDDRGDLRSLLDQIEEGPVRGIDLRVEPLGGGTTPVALTVRRGTEPDGEPELRWVLTDGGAHALARSELRDQLREARAELADRDHVSRWQGTMLGAASHDLRTPLGVITGTIETMLEHWDDLSQDKGRELLEAAHAQSGKLRGVLRGLLELSQLQLQSGRTNRQTVRVRELVDLTLATLDTASHAVEVDVAPSIVADVDPDQVTRIVENLVANAVRHTPTDSTVRVIATADDDDPTALVLTVEDDGPGIADEHKDLVFEPFVHLDDEGGSGLGLAIVAMFAAFHGGRAWVEDGDGGGARFRVLLPNGFPPPAREQDEG